MKSAHSHSDTSHTFFSREELNVYRSLITKKIRDIRGEMEYLIHSVTDICEDRSVHISPDQYQNRDLSSEEAESDDSSPLIKRSQSLLNQLYQALSRIEEGTYGICEVTGNPIARERLPAAPHTQHSITAELMRNNRLN